MAGLSAGDRETCSPPMIRVENDFRADSDHPFNFEALVLEGNNFVNYC
jgi:hypothetical protein